MKVVRHFLAIIISIGIIFSLAGFKLPVSKQKKDKSKSENVYLGPMPIETTQAYQTFLRSPKSETDKLYYLLDRVKTNDKLIFYFERNHFSNFDAYLGGVWILWHHHKKEDAHDFLWQELLRYETPANPILVQFPDRSRFPAYNVLKNELDLLEKTMPQPATTPPAEPKK